MSVVCLLAAARQNRTLRELHDVRHIPSCRTGCFDSCPVLGGFPNNGNGGVATYDAVISPVGSPYTATLNSNVTFEDLLISSANATVDQTANALSATGAITLSAGKLQLNGGTISNSIINLSGGNLAIANNSN